MAAESDPTDECGTPPDQCGTPPSRSGAGMYTSTFAHRRSTSAEAQLLKTENQRTAELQHSKQPSREAAGVRDGRGGKMDRGKAHTVIVGAHHEDRRQLDLAEGTDG